MKKKFVFFRISFCILSLIVNHSVYSQTPKISSSFPTIAPPSPTVSSLMKFEEIPVDNYTGIPDISVPLGNVSDVLVSNYFIQHSQKINNL